MMSTENIFTNYPRWEQVKDIDASHAIDAAFKYAENQQKVWDNLNKEVQGVFDTAQAHKANEVQKVIDAMPAEVLNSPLSTDVINTLTTDAFKDIGGASAKTTAGILGYGDKRRDTLLDRGINELRLNSNKIDYNQKKETDDVNTAVQTSIYLSNLVGQLTPVDYEKATDKEKQAYEDALKLYTDFDASIPTNLRNRVTEGILNSQTNHLTNQTDFYKAQGGFYDIAASNALPEFLVYTKKLDALESEFKTNYAKADGNKDKQKELGEKFEKDKLALNQSHSSLIKILGDNNINSRVLQGLEKYAQSNQEFESRLALDKARIEALKIQGIVAQDKVAIEAYKATNPSGNGGGGHETPEQKESRADAKSVLNTYNIGEAYQAAYMTNGKINPDKAITRGIAVVNTLVDFGNRGYNNKPMSYTDFKATSTGQKGISALKSMPEGAAEKWQQQVSKLPESDKIILLTAIANGELIPYEKGWLSSKATEVKDLDAKIQKTITEGRKDFKNLMRRTASDNLVNHINMVSEVLGVTPTQYVINNKKLFTTKQKNGEVLIDLLPKDYRDAINASTPVVNTAVNLPNYAGKAPPTQDMAKALATEKGNNPTKNSQPNSLMNRAVGTAVAVATEPLSWIQKLFK
ncbi:hypothetical protein ACFBZI_10485 [Moraxella sp. ZJ142]|uniref:hypothetical protein n=1 Tax=Moraxella marmotae TaxID=3344520 RepID=UPI0035D4105C